MGAAGSLPAHQQGGGGTFSEGITVVHAGPGASGPSFRNSGDASPSDRVRQRLEALRLSEPLAKSAVAKAVIQRAHQASDPDLASCASVKSFERWQRAATDIVLREQEELSSRTDAVEALSAKLVKRMQWTSSLVASSVGHLQQVTQLRVEMAKLRNEAQGVYRSLEELSNLMNGLSSVPPGTDESNART